MRSSRVPVSHRAMIDPEIFWKKKEISSKLLWNKSEGNNFRKYFKGVAWKKKENKSKIVRSLRFTTPGSLYPFVPFIPFSSHA